MSLVGDECVVQYASEILCAALAEVAVGPPRWLSFS
jgi:hypothetical protein